MFTKIPLIKNNINIFVAAVVIAGGFLIIYTLATLASSKDDIVHPVAQLGNCKSETECRLYCDNPENMELCLVFAKKHNLISST